MTIKAGDKLPDGKLMESLEFDSTTQCAMPPKEVTVSDAVKGKKIAIFGLPGAYTPTCSAKHVPSYIQNLDALKKKGVNEVWCVSVNDAFVALGQGPEAIGKIRFLADGSALGEGARPGARPERARHGHAHEPLLAAGGQRRGEERQPRGRASSRSPTAPRWSNKPVRTACSCSRTACYSETNAHNAPEGGRLVWCRP
jgi:hypothetical protein